MELRLKIGRNKLVKLSTERLITASKTLYPTANYDYSVATLSNGQTTMFDVKCQVHGSWSTNWSRHIYNKQGCPGCAWDAKLANAVSRFVSNAQKIHAYDYTNTRGINTAGNKSFKFTVNCPVEHHGEWTTDFNRHVKNHQGCPACAGRKPYTVPRLVATASKIHFNQYDYSLVAEFANNKAKITVTCPFHGNFTVSVANHINNAVGCPRCRESRGESVVANTLFELGIVGFQEHKFPDCVNPNTGRFLRFDFYLPHYTACIEFHGIQHYQPTAFTGSSSNRSPWDINQLQMNYLDLLARDKIKEQYCIDNNIKLLVIKYDRISQVAELVRNWLEL